MVYSASPQVFSDGAVVAAESCYPTNGAIDPGETVTVNFALKNTGGANTTNLVATLQSTGGVTAVSGPQTYGALVAGGSSVAKPFTFTASGACGGAITPTLQLQDGAANLGYLTVNFQLGKYTPITMMAQNFDTVTAPALPAGWTTTTSGAQSVWVTSTAAKDTAKNAAYSPDPSSIGVNELVSPNITIASTSAQLTFRNNYNLETSFDGGVLEIKIGSGSFTDILTAGGSFVSGGYNYTLSTIFGNPLGGRQAWSGNSGGFITTVVNLPAAAAGQSIQLKWRCGSDDSNNGPGWYLDTISITDGSFSCCNSSADLALAQQALPNPVVVGNNLTYTLTVTNLGPSAASVTVTDALPAGVTFVSATPSQGTCANASGTVTCNLGTLNSNANATVAIVVTPNTGGSITNRATAGSGVTDPNPANNTITNTVVVASTVMNTSPTNITSQIFTNSMKLSWPVDRIGWRLLAQTQALSKGYQTNATNWFFVAGSDVTNAVIVPVVQSNPAVFYRLVRP